MAEAITCQRLHVEFGLDKLALGQEFRLVQRCYHVSIIPPVHRTHT